MNDQTQKDINNAPIYATDKLLIPNITNSALADEFLIRILEATNWPISNDDPEYNEEIYKNLTKSLISKMMVYENDAFDTYMGKMTPENIQNYLFLVFLYKFWPINFLNILQLEMKEYTEVVIKTNEIKDNLFVNQILFSQVISNFINNDTDIDYNNLCNYVNANINDTHIHDILNMYDIPKFICRLHYLQLINNFINTESFDKLIKDTVFDIFIYFRDNGHLPYNFNWCNELEALNMYVKSYLQQGIGTINVEGKPLLFNDITENINTLCQSTTSTIYTLPNNAVDFKAVFKEMLANTNILNCMNKSVESFALSTVTKEILLSIMSSYLT